MEKLIDLEPVELNDDELAAVAGGAFNVANNNSMTNNSFNGSGNLAFNNSAVSNSMIS